MEFIVGHTLSRVIVYRRCLLNSLWDHWAAIKVRTADKRQYQNNRPPIRLPFRIKEPRINLFFLTSSFFPSATRSAATIFSLHHVLRYILGVCS